MMSEMDARLREAGITKSKKPERYAAAQEAMTRWATSNPSDAADLGKRNARMNMMMAEILIDPPGLFNETSGVMFETDMSEVTPESILKAASAGGLKINDTAISAEAVESVADRFAGRYGREPTPEEIIDALTRYYGNE